MRVSPLPLFYNDVHIHIFMLLFILSALAMSRKAHIIFVISIWLCASLHVSARITADEFSWNIILAISMTIYRETPNYNRGNIRIVHCKWRTKYILLLHATLNGYKSTSFDRNGIMLSAHPPVCPSAAATWLLLEGFIWNLKFGTYMKICQYNPHFVNIWCSTWISKYILVFSVALIRLGSALFIEIISSCWDSLIRHGFTLCE
jgi:hypothetical protein